MSIFLTEEERASIKASISDNKFSNIYWGLMNRTRQRAESPGQLKSGDSTEWWHNATEFLTDGALACALSPSPELKAWLRGVTLDIVRRPVSEWIGPFFRDHNSEPPRGHLETAHLSIAVAIVYDMVPGIFTDSEVMEIKETLKEKGIKLCLNWLENISFFNNWRCILLAGVAVPAAILGDAETLKRVRTEYALCIQAPQPDGSYGESLQYSNYSYFGLMLTAESLLRSQSALLADLNITAYAKSVTWFAYSLLYKKPLFGFGAYPMPRSVNFNDSAAIFGPMGDLLMHIAVRAQELSVEAGLARWIFDHIYAEYPAQGPFDRTTFGFINRCGFLSVLLYPHAAAATSPEQNGLELTRRFSNGNCIARSSWDEEGTVLAFSGPGDLLHVLGHLHADLGSFILVHNRERLLVDPGHSCYRNLIHDLECSTKAHNCCTFRTETVPPHDSLLKMTQIQQRICPHRRINDKHELEAAVKSKGTSLLCKRLDDVSVIGAELAEAYGNPLTSYRRFCIMAGEHAVFVVDDIEASEPVRVFWNWLFNNRDGQLDYKMVYPDRIVARRGNTGMKFFHAGDGSLSGPFYGYVHDAYHPLPAQPGEGKPGSGLQFVWSGKAAEKHLAGHAMAVDSYGRSAGWHFRQSSPTQFALEAPGAAYKWELKISSGKIELSESVSGRNYIVAGNGKSEWKLIQPGEK